jgi:type IV secretion system protein VirB8
MNEISLPAQQVPPDLAKEFFEHTEAIAVELLRAERRSRRIAWTVAAAACAVAVTACFALAALAPQHTVEWRLVRVDSSTGQIDEVQSLRAAPKTIDAANIRALLYRYVMEREGYAAPEAAYDFHAVSLMSTPEEQNLYADNVSGNNPRSPQVTAGKDGFVRIHIKSVAVLGPGLGQVRFSREVVTPSEQPKTTDWLATIGFAIKPNAMMSNADRLINPVGFLVSGYHADPDTP